MQARTWRSWAVLLWALLGCTPEPEPPLRIGTNVWPGYEPLYLARDLGYFDATPVRLVEYTSATEVSRAFRNGAIEAAALTMDETLSLLQYGAAARVVLVMDISHGADVVLGNSEIRELKDIKGRRVGAESSALGAYVLARALQIGGLSHNDVTVVAMPVSEQEQAFKDKRVDALVTFEPIRTHLLAQGARQLFDSSQIPGEIVDVLVVRQDYIDKHPQQVKSLITKWFSSLEYMNIHPDDSSRRMTKRLAVSPAEVSLLFNGLRIPGVEENRKLLGRTPPDLLAPSQKLMQTLLKQGLLNKAVALPPLFTDRYLPDSPL
ncbi:MAG TPA: ABC transporter substrate-binding protein [Gammaproteobacteria bacterium]|nr:ABC transporter substrate-binding protein [Gammaproteobacteria bacterium]